MPREEKRKSGNYGYTAQCSDKAHCTIAGKDFKGTWSYSDTYDNYWGDMKITLDSGFETATNILTFYANDHEKAKDKNKGDDETIGGKGGQFRRTSTST